MRELKKNERFIKEYDKYILIEVMCPHGRSYKTTIDKFVPVVGYGQKIRSENKSSYKSLGFRKGGIYGYN